MKADPFHDKGELDELLKHYNNLRQGRNSIFLEEESFEKIIDHFDDEEDIAKALEAAFLATEYFPFSAPLMIKKADLLLTVRRYSEALEILEKAELYDPTDINLYILRTDAYLAIDQQEKAVALLEEAILRFEGEEKVE